MIRNLTPSSVYVALMIYNYNNSNNKMNNNKVLKTGAVQILNKKICILPFKTK